MNCRYFVCCDHLVYIDAGYRWAYWYLEYPKIIAKDSPFDVTAVLTCKEYWDYLPDDIGYLSRLMPLVRRFLDDHSGHNLVYAEEEWLLDQEDLGFNYVELDDGQQRQEGF